MNITDIAKKRYATKAFDPTKKLSVEQVEGLKDLLRLSPSSVNSQPWHFIMASTDEGKARIAKSTSGPYAFNEGKVKDASHVIMFCAKTDVTDAHLEKVTEQEWTDGRFADETIKADQHKRRQFFVNMHKVDIKDLPEWAMRQVYLNLGAFLLGVGAMGLDAVPIEGFDPAIADQEFSLGDQNLTAVALVAVGHHGEGDFNYPLPKSRLPITDILTEI